MGAKHLYFAELLDDDKTFKTTAQLVLGGQDQAALSQTPGFIAVSSLSAFMQKGRRLPAL
jgi:hypothetical protein